MKLPGLKNQLFSFVAQKTPSVKEAVSIFNDTRSEATSVVNEVNLFQIPRKNMHEKLQHFVNLCSSHVALNKKIPQLPPHINFRLVFLSYSKGFLWISI